MKGNSINGKILRVDLTSGEVSTEATEKYASEFLGGRGINAWILYQEVKPWVAPFDPANRLIFGAGVLGGTLAPGSCRFSVEAKSPMTDAFGSGNAGGYFSAELKYAGYDHIVIKGRARKPVFLWINDGQVEIKDASELWGKTVYETVNALKSEVRDDRIQVACIGPAGENLVRGAMIIANPASVVGRCGLGAVMGSKNLKAVAVRGKKPIKVAHPDRFMEAVRTAWQKAEGSPSLAKMREAGLLAFSAAYPEVRPDYAKNFTDVPDPDRLRKVSPDVLINEYETRRDACASCPLACYRFFHVKDGPYVGLVSEGLTANDICNWAIGLDIDYAPAVIKARDLCSELGLDIDMATRVISWAIECYEKGILTKADTDGLEPKWGDHAFVMEFIRKIAHREGFGDILAEGVMRASQIVGRGSEEYAVHVKGNDDMEYMRGQKGWALGCVVSTRGGTHLRGAHFLDRTETGMFANVSPEDCQRIWGVPKIGDAQSYENKAKPVIYYEILKAVSDSLGICSFFTQWTGIERTTVEDMAELYSAATGREITAQELMTIGRRIHNIEKAFNTLHAGFDRSDDYPPPRFMKEPVKGGEWEGEILTREGWDFMLDEYYRFSGWDEKSGWQFRKCLEDLDLKEVADDLEKAGRLPG